VFGTLPTMTAAARVLVVDDNTELAENLAEILDEEGFECIVCSSGVEALQRLESGPVHAVITDLKMDGMSGLDLLRAVGVRHPQIPVIIMTAYSTDRTAETAQREGALDIVRKPIEIEALLGRVRKILDGSGRILIVEDDVDLRENEVELLSMCPSFDVRSVGTAQEALAACETELPDVILVDIRLPDRDGFQLAAELRARHGAKCPTIVFVSAYPEEVSRALDGFRASSAVPGVLEKPFTPAQLVALVRRVV
jgi:DNA-binding response OmpR family regulator